MFSDVRGCEAAKRKSCFEPNARKCVFDYARVGNTVSSPPHTSTWSNFRAATFSRSRPWYFRYRFVVRQNAPPPFRRFGVRQRNAPEPCKRSRAVPSNECASETAAYDARRLKTKLTIINEPNEIGDVRQLTGVVITAPCPPLFFFPSYARGGNIV